MTNIPPTPDQTPRDDLVQRDRHHAHDHVNEFQRSLNEAAIKGADAALRSALLINGGAAVSVLAFIGGLAAQSRIKLDQLQAVAHSLTLFAFGVAAAVTASLHSPSSIHVGRSIFRVSAMSSNRCRLCHRAGHLTRQSSSSRKRFLRERWTRGSSPRVRTKPHWACAKSE